jgi:predicted dehydrogenase
MKLGIIGAGSIIPFHLKASMEAGFTPTAICGKPGSTNAMKIASSVKGLEFANSVSDLLEKSLDAILIATPASVTAEILKQALKNNVPILVEKPLSTELSQFLEIPTSAHDRIMLGYNRRHYSAVKKFRGVIQESGNGFVRVEIPELGTKHNTSKLERRTSLLENATHILDLLSFILGPITITHKEHMNDEDGIKYTLANFISSNLSIGTISIAYGVPDSPRISMWVGNKSIELSPIENLNISIGMKRVEPTASSPIATYAKEYSHWELDNDDIRFKPGFLRQYLEFYSLVEGKRTNFDSASVLDAQRAISLAHALLD